MSAAKLEKKLLALEHKLREEFRDDLWKGLESCKAKIAELEAFIGSGYQQESGQCGEASDKMEGVTLITDAITVNADSLGPPVAELPSPTSGNPTAEQERHDLNDNDSAEPVPFLESVWNVVMVLGLTGAGWVDIIVSCLLLLMTISIQMAFVVIVSTESFLGDPFETQVPIAQSWRRTVAHDAKYMNLAKVSLTARVCAGDGSLIVAAEHSALISQINSFLGLDQEIDGPNYLTPTSFQPGVMLCMLCVLLWILYMCNELRSIWISAEAVFQLPRSNQTVFEGGHMASISLKRFAAFCFTRLVRTAISICLLGAGVLWLANTTSIQDLILNAVALGAILDIDAMLFAAMMPKKIQLKIQDLEAVHVRYSDLRSQLEALVLGVGALTVALVAYACFVRPLADNMALVKSSYCSGNQNFVVAYNEDVQNVYSLTTVEFGDNQEPTVSELAVEDLTTHDFSEGYAKYAYIFSASDTFDTSATQGMEDAASQDPGCLDFDDLLPEYQGAYKPYFLTTATLAKMPEAQECSQLKRFCDAKDGRSLRRICPATCGCGNLSSNQFFRVPKHGCPGACMQAAAAAAEARLCSDLWPPGQGWKAFWDTWAQLYLDELGAESTDVGNPLVQMIMGTVSAFHSQGCSGLQTLPADPFTQYNFCEGSPYDAFGPLAQQCPESCGCRVDPGGPGCPQSCRAPAGNSSAS